MSAVVAIDVGVSAILFTNARVVDARGERAGEVAVADGRIAPSAPPAAERVDLAGGCSCPAFSTSACAAAAGRRSPPGTSTPASPPPRSTPATGPRGCSPPPSLRHLTHSWRPCGRSRLAARADPTVLGVHLEGPFVNPARKGAMDPDAMRRPDTAEAEALLATGDGGVRMLTLAPELPDALALVELLARRGVVSALGHGSPAR